MMLFTSAFLGHEGTAKRCDSVLPTRWYAIESQPNSQGRRLA